MIIFQEPYGDETMLVQAVAQNREHVTRTVALAVSLNQAKTPGFKANAIALGEFLISKGYTLVTGNKVEKVCDLCNFTVNKNAEFGDSIALAPGGVRIGTSTLTSKGLVEKDYEQIGEFLHRAVSITSKIQKEHGELLKVNNKDIEELKRLLTCKNCSCLR